MADNECIPASLRIGATPAAPRPEVPLDVLLRGITSNYAEWMSNSPHWDPNDTRNLIISMKVALERLQQERDEARREVCAARRELCRNEAIIRLQRHRVHRDSEDVVGLAKEIAVERGWDCFKENTNEPWSAEKHDAIARQIKDTVNEITENTRKAVPQKIDLFKENS